MKIYSSYKYTKNIYTNWFEFNYLTSTNWEDNLKLRLEW